MTELAIKIENVYKEYRLGTLGGGTLRGDLQSWMAKLRGKEDPNSIIGVSNMTLRTGDRFLALDNVSTEVRRGEALGIIGHNGAGKSTLLKLLCRVTAPTKGKISYNGRITSMLEVGTGFHQELTGKENVYMNGAILGMTKNEISNKYDEIVRFAEMEKFIDTPVKRYSSGMYVKLAFSVAAHLDSDILIMDEVLAVGDISFQKKCLKRMRSAAKQEGKTVLYVSHNMNTIRELCDRCVVLDHGKIIYDGDVEKAIEQYTGATDTFKTKYDYSSRLLPRGTRQQVKLESIEFSSNFNGQCYNTDKVELTLRIKSKDNLEHVWIRFELETPDSTIVGFMLCDKDISVDKDTVNEYKTILDLSGLGPDHYIFHVGIHTSETYESFVWQDTVYRAFVLEVVSNPNAPKLAEWNIKSWGHVKLHEAIIEK